MYITLILIHTFLSSQDSSLKCFFSFVFFSVNSCPTIKAKICWSLYNINWYNAHREKYISVWTLLHLAHLELPCTFRLMQYFYFITLESQAPRKWVCHGKKELPLTGRWNNSCTSASNHSPAFCWERTFHFKCLRAAMSVKKVAIKWQMLHHQIIQTGWKIAGEENPNKTKQQQQKKSQPKIQTNPRSEAQYCTTSVYVLFSEGAKEAEAQ